MHERDLLDAALPAYEIDAQIGRGGFGVVYSGRHRRLGRLVAVKLLPRAFGSDPDVRERFLDEARMLAGLDHPHIVPLYDYVEHDGLCVLVLELLRGGTLWDRFKANTIDQPTACVAALAVLSALGRAHETGILHRDIKPDNVLFGDNATIKVTDFGIAKVVSRLTRGVTRTGEILGTPSYMAPEQVRGESLTAATDLYSAAVMLYELLVRKLPFETGSDSMRMLYCHVHEAPETMPSTVPQPIADVVMRGLAKAPSERFENAAAMAIALAGAVRDVWGRSCIDDVGIRLTVPPAVNEALLSSDRVVRTTVSTPSSLPSHAASDLVAIMGGNVIVARILALPTPGLAGDFIDDRWALMTGSASDRLVAEQMQHRSEASMVSEFERASIARAQAVDDALGLLHLRRRWALELLQEAATDDAAARLSTRIDDYVRVHLRDYTDARHVALDRLAATVRERVAAVLIRRGAATSQVVTEMLSRVAAVFDAIHEELMHHELEVVSGLRSLVRGAAQLAAPDTLTGQPNRSLRPGAELVVLRGLRTVGIELGELRVALDAAPLPRTMIDRAEIEAQALRCVAEQEERCFSRLGAPNHDSWGFIFAQWSSTLDEFVSARVDGVSGELRLAVDDAVILARELVALPADQRQEQTFELLGELEAIEASLASSAFGEPW